MPTLVYCCELEKTAIDRAKLCDQMDSVPQGNLIENNYNFTKNLNRTLVTAANNMASDLTTGLGCAVVHCGNRINVVCHYETTLANAVKLYTCGPTCNRCENGTTSCVNGLCPAASETCSAATTTAAPEATATTST
ncbi:hypothetical protein OESDEN_24432 [Oesophagostomum dentatum]|uniref:Uncharacterized protein n=1 Tax=Oesophagostomum dentatum TaxID=61180 RepID=A0A0B1RTF4_OESDE|nr:hypothetical protein OESDEN_24432 [Oesophagostomum dentatum]